MAETMRVNRPLTPPDHEHDVPAATDEERAPAPLSKKAKKKQKKKQAEKMARTTSISSHTTVEPNGAVDVSHYHLDKQHPSSVLSNMPPSPVEPVVEEPAAAVYEQEEEEEEEEEEEQGVIVDKTTAMDPDGDVTLVLTVNTSTSTGSVVADDHHHKDQPQPPTAPKHVHRIQVSSSHLCLASPVFKARLRTGKTSESRTLAAQGGVAINLPGDSEPGMVLLQNILHNRSLHIPRSVALRDMAELSVLVDRYDAAPSTNFVARTWAANLFSSADAATKPLPAGYTSHDIIRWLFVSWVFCLPEYFRAASKAAAREIPGRIDKNGGDALGLPFPEAIVDAVDKIRQSLIQGFIDIYSNMINRYCDENKASPLCSNGDEDCDKGVLGSLVMSGRRAHVFSIPPATTTFSSSAKSLRDQLSSVTFPPCPEGVPASVGRRRLGSSRCLCRPGSDYSAAMGLAGDAVDNPVGLEVYDFLPESRAQQLRDMPGNPPVPPAAAGVVVVDYPASPPPPSPGSESDF
ncbi:uncharacterized protein MKZ38_003307 [Zalerion maritima]|uniref:BTB domain-containing protein n=1 Tax=Zalerion maritima TaxID=339359 RepID=A0AAD5RMY4_9PEZI|nr:uncharacterized protein MKZ38_003307 [Zalerion maritima]